MNGMGTRLPARAMGKTRGEKDLEEFGDGHARSRVEYSDMVESTNCRSYCQAGRRSAQLERSFDCAIIFV
jgi:hypothetical protein